MFGLRINNEIGIVGIELRIGVGKRGGRGYRDSRRLYYIGFGRIWEGFWIFILKEMESYEFCIECM